MLTLDDLKRRLLNACDELRSHKEELSEIDAKFGDADHGYTMAKIADEMAKAINENPGDLKTLLDDCAMSIITINGGSAVPLWNIWMDALKEKANESVEMEDKDVQEMFRYALEELSDFSGAKVGDKTMMDAMIPATEAIVNATGDINDIFKAGAKAASDGAEATKNMKSKFGRAKMFGDKTLGTPDCGALSCSYFFVGLAKD